MSVNFLEAISQIKDIKKMESTLPIARKVVNVVPLTVGDDLGLRTSITSPSGYDREIIKLLHKKVEFVQGETTYTEDYDKFCNEISNIDKITMLWALYKVTYETLGERKITCPKCKDNNDNPFVFRKEINILDLLHEDSLTLWEEELPFYEYIFPIKINYEDKIDFEFDTVIPSMSRYNQVLGMVSTGQLQQNLEKIGQVFTKPMQMSLLTKKIKLIINGEEIESSGLQEILIAFENHVPEIVSEKFYEEYNNKFNKYIPKFYDKVTCPNCGHQFNYDVDIELSFFRRTILSGESG